MEFLRFKKENGGQVLVYTLSFFHHLLTNTDKAPYVAPAYGHADDISRCMVLARGRYLNSSYALRFSIRNIDYMANDIFSGSEFSIEPYADMYCLNNQVKGKITLEYNSLTEENRSHPWMESARKYIKSRLYHIVREKNDVDEVQFDLETHEFMYRLEHMGESKLICITDEKLDIPFKEHVVHVKPR